MLNRIADKILNAVLPHQQAAAICGPWQYRPCGCSGGLRYMKKCRDCTGAGGGCGSCFVSGTC
ncbi:MAG: hypothetical protein ACRCZD_10175 [Phycicoccus sp.]